MNPGVTPKGRMTIEMRPGRRKIKLSGLSGPREFQFSPEKLYLMIVGQSSGHRAGLAQEANSNRSWLSPALDNFKSLVGLSPTRLWFQKNQTVYQDSLRQVQLTGLEKQLYLIANHSGPTMRARGIGIEKQPLS